MDIKFFTVDRFDSAPVGVVMLFGGGGHAMVGERERVSRRGDCRSPQKK